MGCLEEGEEMCVGMMMRKLMCWSNEVVELIYDLVSLALVVFRCTHLLFWRPSTPVCSQRYPTVPSTLLSQDL